MNSEKKNQYALLLQEEQISQETRRLEEAERLKKQQELSEIQALIILSRSGQLEEIVARYGGDPVPPIEAENEPRRWPKGVDENSKHSFILSRTVMTDEKLELLRRNVRDYYPAGCEVHEYVTKSGNRAAIITGVSADESRAIRKMIAEELELKIALQAEKSQQQKPELAGLKEDISKALNPEVAPPAIETESSPSPTPKRTGEKIKQLV